MQLSIIVTHFRKPEMLKLCLQSIQQTIGSIEHEILVLDSMTFEPTQLLMREHFPELTFIPFKDNVGYAKLVNTGLTRARGEYILVMNSDMVMTEGAVATMLAYLAKHTDIGMLGPRLLNFNDTHQQSYFRFYTPMTIIARRTILGYVGIFKKTLDDFVMAGTDPNQIQTPDWIMGSAMMTRRQAVNKVGPMDESFFMYFEDVDWCRRFWHNGYKVVYYPKAVMYHYLGRGSKSWLGVFDALFNKKTHWHLRSAFKFFKKYRNLERFRQFS